MPTEAAATGPTVQLGRRDTPTFGLPVITPGSDEGRARVYDAPSIPAVPVPPPTYQVPSYGPAPVGSGSLAQQSNNALLSMVLGIVSLFMYMVLFCVGMAPVAAVVAIPAIMLGNKARREIRAAQGRITGDGMALAGVITGWITIALSILALVLVVLAIIGFAALGSLD